MPRPNPDTLPEIRREELIERFSLRLLVGPEPHRCQHFHYQFFGELITCHEEREKWINFVVSSQMRG